MTVITAFIEHVPPNVIRLQGLEKILFMERLYVWEGTRHDG